MLKGNHIILRPLKDSDLDFLEEIENNKENWQFGSEKLQYTKQQLIEYISKAKTDIKIAKQYRFVIDLSGTAIGFIDLFDYKIASASIGLIITKNFRNKGFAKEALKLLYNYGFNILNIQQLYATIRIDNLFSIKLFKSCKFTLKRENSGIQYFIKLAKK